MGWMAPLRHRGAKLVSLENQQKTGAIHEPNDQFRTIQVYPKDVQALPVHPEHAVSWHDGFRGGAHARPKAMPVPHAARRRGGVVAGRRAFMFAAGDRR
jgi:hypothetical protein